jgi:beta-glucosidase
MEGRTYRYMTDEPLYTFGYGLSYARFVYSDCELSQASLDTSSVPHDLSVRVRVENAGGRAGDEVVQLYLHNANAECTVPRHRLAGVQRVHLEAEEAAAVSFGMDAGLLSYVSPEGERVLAPGDVRVCVGGRQPDARSEALFRREGLPLEMGCATLELTGERRVLPR